MKIIGPLILILAAAGLSFAYVKPVWQSPLLMEKNFLNPTGKSIAMLKDEKKRFLEAMQSAREAERRLAELIDRRTEITSEELARLNRLLPDKVDTIRLVVDMQGIAARHGMAVKDITFSGKGDGENASPGAPAEVSSFEVPGLKSVSLSFGVRGPYVSLISFLSDVEKSLQPLEIVNLSFSSSDDGLYPYKFTLRTFYYR